MHNRGRQKASVDLEKALLSEAALSLAILGGNKNLCQELSQKKPNLSVNLEKLHSMGLPSPSLALMHDEIFGKNLTLVDQLFQEGSTQGHAG